jgi:membrane fusion protein (multidrug efflux system)
MASTSNPNPEAGSPEAQRVSATSLDVSRASMRGRKLQVKIMVGLVLIVLIVGILLVYRHYSQFESTDDAQIDGYIYPVSARVGGYVTRVTVDDDQFVKAGTVLVQLDPKDYDVAVANAKAAFANDNASTAAQQTNIPITSINTSSQLDSAKADVDNAKAGLGAAERQYEAAQASLLEAEANDAKAMDDVERYRPLAAKDEIPQQRYTQAVDAEKATAAAVKAAEQSAAAAAQGVNQARAKIEQAQASVKAAETRPSQIAVQRSRAEAAQAESDRTAAALQQAQLNLQYTTIVAPIDGIIGQRSVQPGQNVSIGQQLMSIVPLDSQNIWVTANFKETQLTYMRPGQPVKISVDTYGREYDGHVDSISGASGARFSLLPPENATGNYVKVVQRIPVKIYFEKGQDPEHLLRPGMSVEPQVRVK